jgi:hypothetical protein
VYSQLKVAELHLPASPSLSIYLHAINRELLKDFSLILYHLTGIFVYEPGSDLDPGAHYIVSSGK